MSEHPPLPSISIHVAVSVRRNARLGVPSVPLHLQHVLPQQDPPADVAVPEVVRRVERDPGVLASPPHSMSDLLADQAGEQPPVSEAVLKRHAGAEDLYELWRDWYETAGAGCFPRRYSYSPRTHVHVAPRESEELGDAQPGRFEERDDEAVTLRGVLDDQGDFAGGRGVGDAAAARRQPEARIPRVVRGDAQMVEHLLDDVQVSADRLATRALLDEGRYEALQVLESDSFGRDLPERESRSHRGLDGLQVARPGGSS